MSRIPDFVFDVRTSRQSNTRSCRVGALHYEVFHGTGRRPNTEHASNLQTLTPQSRKPASTSDNREQLVITRSGSFVPPVFLCNRLLIVNESIRQKIMGLDGIEFLPVIFEKLVHLEMPALGNFDWYNSQMRHTHQEYSRRKDRPELHESIGVYYEVLGANCVDIDERYNDWVEVPPDFGNYCGLFRPIPRRISWNAFRDFAMIDNVVRPDLFAILAPYLDLDYFAISIIARE